MNHNTCVFLTDNQISIEGTQDTSQATKPEEHTVNIHYVEPCFPSGCRVCCSNNTNPVWTRMRYNVKVLVEHKYFEWFIVFLIAASSIALVSKNEQLVTKFANDFRYFMFHF